MLVSDIISRVRKAAGDVDILQFTDATIIEWVNDAANECASNNLLLQKSATQVVVNGQTDYTFPTDILKLHSIRYDNEKLDISTMAEFDDGISGFGDLSKGTPITAYVWANKLTLYPAPDNSTKVLNVSYTRTPTPVAAPADTPDLPVMYHRRIVDYCLAMVAEQDDDANRYAIKMEEFNTGVKNLKDQAEWEYDTYPSMSVSARDGSDTGMYYE